MSDLAMYEALAAAAIRRHRKNAAMLRSVLSHFEHQAENTSDADHREGLELVVKRLRDALAQLDLPLSARDLAAGERRGG